MGSCDFLCWLWAQVLSKSRPSIQARGEKLGNGTDKCENVRTICSKYLWNLIRRGCRHTNHGFAEGTTNVTGDVLDAA